MSIQGISSGYANPAFMPGITRPSGTEEAATQPTHRPDAERAAAATQSRSTQAAIPAEAPAGTDPSLWSVLTSEERAFFARARSMGPLTYGPGRPESAVPGVQLGGRIDVKV